MDDEAFYHLLKDNLEQRYLATTGVRGQSGFRGDADRWERARRVITEPMVNDGAWLDIGCANGHLMETVVDWTAQGGVAIEPYGLDLSPRLAELARSRLPHWSERIWAGNAMTWHPPRRFDYVRTELGYVPEGRRPGYITRLLTDYLRQDGVAIVCSCGSAQRSEPAVADIATEVRSLGFEVAGASAATDINGVVFTRVCWMTGG